MSLSTTSYQSQTDRRISHWAHPGQERKICVHYSAKSHACRYEYNLCFGQAVQPTPLSHAIESIALCMVGTTSYHGITSPYVYKQSSVRDWRMCILSHPPSAQIGFFAICLVNACHKQSHAEISWSWAPSLWSSAPNWDLHYSAYWLVNDYYTVSTIDQQYYSVDYVRPATESYELLPDIPPR